MLMVVKWFSKFQMKQNWLFPVSQKNIVHDITVDDINQLLFYAQQDDAWAEELKNRVSEREKAISDGTYTGNIDWIIEEI